VVFVTHPERPEEDVLVMAEASTRKVQAANPEALPGKAKSDDECQIVELRPVKLEKDMISSAVSAMPQPKTKPTSSKSRYQ